MNEKKQPWFKVKQTINGFGFDGGQFKVCHIQIQTLWRICRHRAINNSSIRKIWKCENETSFFQFKKKEKTRDNDKNSRPFESSQLRSSHAWSMHTVIRLFERILLIHFHTDCPASSAHSNAMIAVTVASQCDAMHGKIKSKISKKKCFYEHEIRFSFFKQALAIDANFKHWILKRSDWRSTSSSRNRKKNKSDFHMLCIHFTTFSYFEMGPQWSGIFLRLQ